MSHLEFMVLWLTMLGGFYLLDGKIERATSQQSARTDKLYEMFIDLLKQKEKQNGMDKNLNNINIKHYCYFILYI